MTTPHTGTQSDAPAGQTPLMHASVPKCLQKAREVPGTCEDEALPISRTSFDRESGRLEGSRAMPQPCATRGR